MINKSNLRYALKSKINKQFLSNLFEDKHAKQFQQEIYKNDTCYSYSSIEIARDIAKQLEAGVITINELN